MSPGEGEKSVQIDTDGELIDKLFCLYCGELNHPGVDICENCGKYIADQGPDLHSRLRRISRHASSVHSGRDDDPPSDLIGSVYTAFDEESFQHENEASTQAKDTWRFVDGKHDPRSAVFATELGVEIMRILLIFLVSFFLTIFLMYSHR
jgi:hypothetical protein